MKSTAHRFDWRLFFKRIWGGLLVSTFWVASCIFQRRGIVELGIAFNSGFIIGPVIGYVWTQASSKKLSRENSGSTG